MEGGELGPTLLEHRSFLADLAKVIPFFVLLDQNISTILSPIDNNTLMRVTAVSSSAGVRSCRR